MKFLATSVILTTIAAPLVVPAKPAPQPGASAAQAWFGTFTRRTGSPTDVVGDLTITAMAGKPHVEIFIMNERTGCEGGVAGSLTIDGTHAQLSPPLWTVDQ